MRGWIALVGALWLWLNATAMAEEGGAEERLEQVRTMVVHAKYGEAEEAARALLARSDLRSHQRIGALEALAIVQIAERNEEAALRTLRALYALDPEHTIAELDVSPVVLSVFARVREHPPDPVTVRMDHEPPDRLAWGHAVPVRIRVTEGAGAVETVALRYRTGADETETRVLLPVDADGTAHGLIPLKGRGPHRVRYHIEARAPSGAVLERIGARGDPIEMVTRPPSLDEREGSAPDALQDPADRFRLVEQWWFWTVLGVTVVGAATGIAVGASGSDGGGLPTTTLGSGALQ